jgi:energy-coupling factor transport system ATP-binding protein
MVDIDITGLSFSYPAGPPVLQGVNLQVAPGERLALIGGNGCGKTTLVRHLNGLLRPSHGMVRIGDWVTDHCTAARLAQRVGFVFQNPDEQLCRRRVKDEVAFGAINLGYPADQIARLTSQALAWWELTGNVDTNPHDLSLAWRRRLAIASVMAMDPPVIVLDEPTVNQDLWFHARLVELFATWQLAGKVVIVICHDLDFVAEQFDRVVLLSHGRIAADGSPSQVFQEEQAMSQAGLEAPQLFRLSRELGWAEKICTTETFLAALKKYHQP